MKLGAIILALGLATAAQAQSRNTGLDALADRSALLGWEAVGKVDLGNGFCTGTLIATNLVMTAAHCVYDDATGQPRDVAKMTFRAGLNGDSAVATAGVARAVAHPAYDPESPMSVENIRHDLALLELAQPIPAAVAAPFVVKQAGRLREVSVVSYAAERANFLSWQRVCQVTGQGKGLMSFDCDVFFGSSGAPVFDRSGNRARIVSVISAGHREGGASVSYGMELPTLVEDLKAALRTGRGVMTAQTTAAPVAPALRRITPSNRTTGAKFLRP